MKEIKISKLENGKTQYLSEILPEIPTNTILYKKLTGLGATYGEIKAKRHSIIIEPNKPVIVGKGKDPKHKEDNILGVYEGVYSDEKIVPYLEKSIKQGKFFKILTTPESFHKVQDAFEELEIDIRYECFLLFDECHKIIKDVDYRADIALPMDFFFECQNKALVSATPLEFTDPRFEEQNFQYISIVPDFDYSRQIEIRTTNNLIQCFTELVEQLQDRRCFIFCNSTDMTHALMNMLDLIDKSTVFCSDKSVDKLNSLSFNNAFDIFEPKRIKQYNWLTSRFYNAVDIELDEKPVVILLTDCYNTDYTVFDPFTDAIQCIGRFRNGIEEAFLVSNCNESFQVRTKEELKGFIECSKEIYYKMKSLHDYATTISARDAFRAALETLPFTKRLDPNGNINYFSIDNYINDRLVKGYYQCPDNLIMAYQKCDSFNVVHSDFSYSITDVQQIRLKNNSISLREKRMIIVEQLDAIGVCMTEMEFEFRNTLVQSDPVIVEAYDKLGREEIERLKYKTKAMKEAIILHDYHNKAHGTEAFMLLNNSFSEGQWYSSSQIKSEISRIFKLLDIHPAKAPTSHTICEFFEAIEKKQNNVRGYLIIKSKTL